MANYQPSEAEWNTYGTMFAASRFGSRLLRVALWGIQTFMVVSGISTFGKLSKERRKGYRRFLLFSGVILAVTSLDLGLDIWIVFRNLFQGGPSPRSYVEAFRADDMNESFRRPQIVTIALRGATIILSDILMAMWTGWRWLLAPPSVACAGSFAARLVFLIRMLPLKTAYPVALGEFSVIAESLSVFVNVMVTGLILFELRTSCLAICRVYPHRKRPSMYTTTMARMVESAAPLTFFGIIYVTVTALIYSHRPESLTQKGALNSICEVSASLYYSFSALSPQMMIFRVLDGQLWKNTQESMQLTEIVSQSLRFAIPDPTPADEAFFGAARGLHVEVPAGLRDEIAVELRLEFFAYNVDQLFRFLVNQADHQLLIVRDLKEPSRLTGNDFCCAAAPTLVLQ
ncbi:hypothetical protein BKA70DRAFT_1398269 [Coprinopsis sp. MPI-PUGE-AT-0042]|nr:hypothetical protein BKA70DRAFT_1398269 [Coprinopsis sp. MPI-PUGE-AT-0042]